MALFKRSQLALFFRSVPIGGVDDVIKAEWGNEGDKSFVIITLPESSSRLGAAMPKPMKIGVVNGQVLGFYAAFTATPDINLVTLQFVLGGNYE